MTSRATIIYATPMHIPTPTRLNKQVAGVKDYICNTNATTYQGSINKSPVWGTIVIICNTNATTHTYTSNSYIPSAREVSDLKVSGATRPRPLNQILPKHEVYNYFVSHP